MLGTFSGTAVAVSTHGEYADVLLLQEVEGASPTVVECYVRLKDYADPLPTAGERVDVFGRVTTSTFGGNVRTRVAVKQISDSLTGARLAAVS